MRATDLAPNFRALLAQILINAYVDQSRLRPSEREELIDLAAALALDYGLCRPQLVRRRMEQREKDRGKARDQLELAL